MNQIIYKLYKAEIQHNIKKKDGFEMYSGVGHDLTNGYLDYENELISTFNNKEGALKELEKYESSYVVRDSYNTGYVVYIEEYYVEEVEVDEDGDFVSGGDIWAFSK